MLVVLSFCSVVALFILCPLFSVSCLFHVVDLGDFVVWHCCIVLLVVCPNVCCLWTVACHLCCGVCCLSALIVVVLFCL